MSERVLKQDWKLPSLNQAVWIGIRTTKRAAVRSDNGCPDRSRYLCRFTYWNMRKASVMVACSSFWYSAQTIACLPSAVTSVVTPLTAIMKDQVRFVVSSMCNWPNYYMLIICIYSCIYEPRASSSRLLLSLGQQVKSKLHAQHAWWWHAQWGIISDVLDYSLHSSKTGLVQLCPQTLPPLSEGAALPD